MSQMTNCYIYPRSATHIHSGRSAASGCKRSKSAVLEKEVIDVSEEEESDPESGSETEVESSECKKCQKVFPSKTSLGNHMRIHNKAKGKHNKEAAG